MAVERAPKYDGVLCDAGCRATGREQEDISAERHTAGFDRQPALVQRQANRPRDQKRVASDDDALPTPGPGVGDKTEVLT